MATGGEVAGSREQRSDVVHEYTCSTCSKSDRTTQASHYCPECDVCYCKLCLCDHVVIGRSKVEQWGKDAGTNVKAGDKHKEDERLNCLKHPQYDVELYCVDHDVVCCRLCPSTEHRSCIHMEKIVVATEKHNLKDELQNISENIDSLRSKADFLSEESEIKKHFTESSHTKYVSQVLEMKTNISAKFDQIIEEADHRKQHYIDKFNMDQFQCTDIKDTVPKLKSALEPSPDKDKHFIKVKRTNEFVGEANKKMSGIIGTEIEGVFEELPFEGERKLLQLLTTEVHFKMSGLKFRVRTKEDKVECEIVGICQIGNGHLVLADKANKRIKQLNRDYTVINNYELQEIPNDVCAVDDTEVVVALQNNTVLIVNVGTEFEIVRSLKMQHGCLKVANHAGKFYIADSLNCNSAYYECLCRTEMYVCDSSGQEIANFGTSNNNCHYVNQKSVAISQDGQIIYVAHPGGYIISFDPEGNKLAESTQFKDVVGLCTNESGNLFACTSNSKEVIELSPTDDFKKIKTVLFLEDRDITPRAICYDEKLGRVVVGTGKGDYIYLD